MIKHHAPQAIETNDKKLLKFTYNLDVLMMGETIHITID